MFKKFIKKFKTDAPKNINIILIVTKNEKKRNN